MPLLLVSGTLAVTAVAVMVFLRRRAKIRRVAPDRAIEAPPRRATKHVEAGADRPVREIEVAAEPRRQEEKAIEAALHRSWFELRFQAQYDLRRCRLTGFETLVRMN